MHVENIEIRKPKNVQELLEIMDVMKSAWHMPDYRDAVPHHMLKAVMDNGGVLLIAYDKKERKVIGFVLGILAMDERGRIYHYSHMLGVREGLKYKGIGYRLKLAQREYVVKQGLDLIKWTFDPLLGPNAKLNFAKLGVINRVYHVNYYGELHDELNRGMPTDRFKVEWYIKSRRVMLRLAGKLPPPSLKRALTKGELITETSKIKDNIRKLVSYNLDSSSELIIVEIPADINYIKTVSMELALDWRLKTREIFKRYINERGYIVVDFISEIIEGERRNFYLLWKTSLNRILEGELPC